jgi:hypothetical protein
LVLTLCNNCLSVFISDRNYIVTYIRQCKPTCELEPHECECDICTRPGRIYDIVKLEHRIISGGRGEE